MEEVCMSLRSEIQRPSSAIVMPLAAPSWFTWVVIFRVSLLKCSLSLKDDITSTHPGMEGKWLYRWPTKAAREAFKTILGGSGNFPKHSDSEEVLFKIF